MTEAPSTSDRSRFDLAATALGLTIAQALLLREDEVIQ